MVLNGVNKKYDLVLDGVHQATHKTRDIDVKRIAIRATDNFLKEYEQMIDIDKLLTKAVDYEQMIYESAKRLNLTCDPLEEERLRTRDFEPLKLHLYMKPYEGKFITIGGRDEGSKTKDETEGELHVKRLSNTRRVSRGFRDRS